MAPEMIYGNYFKASDVWSIGVIMYIMVTGKQPFSGRSKCDVLNKVKSGKYDIKSLYYSKCSNSVKDLLEKCW